MPPVWKETFKELLSGIDPWLFGWTIVVLGAITCYLVTRMYAVIYLWGQV